ncbi:DNA-directed RNA polymerase subunit delta [Mycoplasma buteonis]|uniref:DNA-directed RNA polymerase subunit delta n=1 Tax=Mycoplasma buteonis TaxID=171280 RepID=UPI00055D1A9E|nr:hypothetical protein [Mycoplasma buteonis]
MKTKTMLEIAIETISEDTLKPFTFDQLFEIVEAELKDKWIDTLEDRFSDEQYQKVRTRKMGELYRLLTVDKRFSRNSDGTWQSATYEIYK